MEDFTPQQIKTLTSVVSQIVKDEGRQNQDLMRQEMKALEHRLDAKSEKNKEEIINFIDERILPQIESLDQRLTKLETKIA
jgi:uncharacterized coiled-coil protein SlyX